MEKFEKECAYARLNFKDLTRAMAGLVEATQAEISNPANNQKTGRGAAYQSLFDQGKRVRAELDRTTQIAREVCSAFDDMTARREALIRELNAIVKGVLIEPSGGK